MVGEQYVLEVSSPGSNGRCGSPADWRRFVGQPGEGAGAGAAADGECEIVAVDGDDGHVTLSCATTGRREHRLPLAAVSEARLVYWTTWNR